MSQKLTVRDLITVGIFATLYFLMVGIVTFAMMMLFPTGGHFFLPAAVALVVGPIYFLVKQKVPKFGVITILSGVMGVFFMVGGYFPLAFIPSFIFGFIADYVTFKIAGSSKVKELIAYVIFGFCVFGPILPMVFMQQQYIDQLLAKGKPQSYIDSVFYFASPQMFAVTILATIACGVIGGIVGQKFVEKNFSKR